jgi:hypothetical protein
METKKRNYKDTSLRMDNNYKENCVWQLANNFSYVSLASIREQLALHNSHFIPAAETLRKLVDSKSGTIKFIKTRRNKKSDFKFSPEFDEEYAFYLESVDHDLATKLNETYYEEEGQGIGCCCCCESVPFESLTQCNAGHLFCLDCVKNYVENEVFTELRNELHCIDTASKCQEPFPESTIKKALSPEVYQKYVKFVQMIEIKKAGLEGLTNCLHCDYMYCMGPDDTVFNCRGCNKQTCILCEQTAHPNQPCPKKEILTEEHKRKAVEEELTKLRLRKCQCGTEFIKTEGCNKIHCTKCNKTMCYVCQQSNIGYEHFCGCPDRGTAKAIKECAKCKKCTLFFTNTEKIDEEDVDSLLKKRKFLEASSIDLTEDDLETNNNNKRARLG